MNISTNQVLHLFEGTAVKTDTKVAGVKPASYLKITQSDGKVKTSPLFTEVVSTQNITGGFLKKNKTTLSTESFEATKGNWYSLTLRYGGFSIEDSNTLTVSYQATSDGDDIVKALGDMLKAQVDKVLVNEKGVPALTVESAANSVSVTDEDPMYNPSRFDVNNIKCLGLEISVEDDVPTDNDFNLKVETIDSATKNGAKYACMEHFAMGERGGQTNYRGWPFYHEVGSYLIDPTKKYDATIYHLRYFGDIQDYHSTDFDVIVLKASAKQ